MGMKVAFLGLGVMGYPMAGHLVKAGHIVTVYNRTTAKAEKWVAEHGGSMGATPAEAATGADFVMACVGNDDDLRAVCVGDDGAFAGMSAGSVFVDHTIATGRTGEPVAPLNFVASSTKQNSCTPCATSESSLMFSTR